MIYFLFTMGLCALIHTATAQELRMDDVIPTEERVQIMHLSNGVKTYVQEHALPSQSCSLRVVLRKSPCGQQQFSFDGTPKDQDSIENFFALCKQKIVHDSLQKQPQNICTTFCSDLPLVCVEQPQDLAIIAVGDFVAKEMQDLMQRYFGDIVLESLGDDDSSIQIAQDERVSKVLLGLSYPNPSHPILTYQDLKETWKILLMQALFQQRLERCSRGVDEAWFHPYRQFFYPVNGYAFVSEEAMENLLSFFLWQVEAVRNDGFFDDEFFMTKGQLVGQLQYLAFNASEPDNVFLASYYADQFLLGDRCLDYHYFLDASVTLVEQIRFEDLFSYLESFFANSGRQIRVLQPMPMHAKLLTKDRVEELIARIASLASFYRDSDVPEDSVWTLDANEVSTAPTKLEEPFEFVTAATTADDALFRFADAMKATPMLVNSVEPFYGLPLTEKEKRFINIIISTMADKNIIQLVFEKGSLEKKGKRIHHVHPLRFMGYILSSPDLKENVRTIRKSTFKWDAFVDGFAKRMREELSKGNVYQHVPGFAAQIGSTPEHVNEYIQRKDFEGLIKSLL